MLRHWASLDLVLNRKVRVCQTMTTIEKLHALNRELILKVHQEAVEETMQTLKKKVIRLIAASVPVAIKDFILLVFFVSIRALLRRYWYRSFGTPGIEEDEPDYRPSRRHKVPLSDNIHFAI